MGKPQEWKIDLDEYIRQGEPGQAEKSAAWQTAIGLQDVDGLKTSGYLLETAKEHIEGSIDMNAAKKRIQTYYEERKGRFTDTDEETREADLVSLHIAELLGEKTFQFSPASYINIHKRLFTGVFPHAGQLRSYNITKNEWILNGETVYYASYDAIRDTLDYDFYEKNGEYFLKVKGVKRLVFNGILTADFKVDFLENAQRYIIVHQGNNFQMLYSSGYEAEIFEFMVKKLNCIPQEKING